MNLNSLIVNPKIYFYAFIALTITSLFYPDALLTAAGILATVPLVMIINFSLKSGTFIQQLFAIGYIAGSVSCWVFGFLACYYYHFDIARHPWITLILINISNWSAFLGSMIAVRKQKSNLLESYSIPSFSISRHTVRKGIIVSSILFLTYVIISYLSGAFNARFIATDYAEAGSLQYFLGGLSFFQPLLFIFLGASFSNTFLSYRNLLQIVTLIFALGFLSLSGGREALVQLLLYFVLGILLFTEIPKKQIFYLTFTFVLLFSIWFNAVGYARQSLEFAKGDFADRIEIIFNIVLEGNQEQGSKYDDPLYGLFTRITEPTGQVVIDGVVDRDQYIGFANLDRVILIFLPKFLMPEGIKNYDDKDERLERYGVYSKFGAAAPITVMADSFERGGFLGVGIVSFLISFILTRLANFLSKIKFKNSLFGTILLISYAFFSFRIYASSVLVVINLLTYSLFRDSLLLYVFLMLLGKPKSSQTGSITASY